MRKGGQKVSLRRETIGAKARKEENVTGNKGPAYAEESQKQKREE